MGLSSWVDFSGGDTCRCFAVRQLEYLSVSCFGEKVGPEERVCLEPAGGIFLWP